MGEDFDPSLPVYMQRLDEVIKHLNVVPQMFKWHCLIEFAFYRFMSWRHLSLALTVVI